LKNSFDLLLTGSLDDFWLVLCMIRIDISCDYVMTPNNDKQHFSSFSFFEGEKISPVPSSCPFAPLHC
jgi:hypothetical protein